MINGASANLPPQSDEWVKAVEKLLTQLEAEVNRLRGELRAANGR